MQGIEGKDKTASKEKPSGLSQRSQICSQYESGSESLGGATLWEPGKCRNRQSHCPELVQEAPPHLFRPQHLLWGGELTKGNWAGQVSFSLVCCRSL